MHDLIIEIWESVRRNKLRTCLTGFAVSWGIFMLIVLLGAGNGVKNAFVGSGENFASNTMMIGGGVTSKPYDGLKQGRRVQLDEGDMAFLSSGVFSDKIEKVSSTASKDGFTLVYGQSHFNNINVTATYPGDKEMNRVTMECGRFINEIDIDNFRKVVILPHLVARNLLKGDTDYEKLIGKRVKLGNVSFAVIGVRHGFENQNDRALYIPFSTFKRLFSNDNKVGDITFSFHGLESEAENEQFEKDLKAAVNSLHRAAPDDESAVWIWNRFVQNMQMNKGGKVINIALWIIGIFTLLGGVVGVSNIMLITVRERTHEFGIRKAIGAKPWSITKLIIAESVLITAVFGYVGMVLGLVACEVLDATVGQNTMDLFGMSLKLLDNPSVGVDTAIGATIVLIIAGTLAGLAPALKAAKVKPIEALMTV